MTDWVAGRRAFKRTSFSNEVAEMALAYAVGDKVEAAYRRGDLFEKRRALMDAWAEACSPKTTRGPLLIYGSTAPPDS